MGNVTNSGSLKALLTVLGSALLLKDRASCLIGQAGWPQSRVFLFFLLFRAGVPAPASTPGFSWRLRRELKPPRMAGSLPAQLPVQPPSQNFQCRFLQLLFNFPPLRLHFVTHFFVCGVCMCFWGGGTTKNKTQNKNPGLAHALEQWAILQSLIISSLLLLLLFLFLPFYFEVSKHWFRVDAFHGNL